MTGIKNKAYDTLNYVDQKLDVAEDYTKAAISNAATKTWDGLMYVDQKLD